MMNQFTQSSTPLFPLQRGILKSFCPPLEGGRGWNNRKTGYHIFKNSNSENRREARNQILLNSNTTLELDDFVQKLILCFCSGRKFCGLFVFTFGMI